MISNDTLIKIEALFHHLQMLSYPSVQMYDPTQEFRTHCIIAVGLNWKKDCQSVYLNFPMDKIRSWHLKNWEKRKREIPHESFLLEFPSDEVVRFGFKV